MYKNYLRDIDGVAIYPIFSLIIFVSFFIWLGYMVFRADKDYISHMGNLPLSSDEKMASKIESKTTNQL